MFQTITRLELFPKGLLITDVVGKFWLQLFQEMELSIELHTIGDTGGSMCIDWLKGVKMLATISEL